VIIVWIWDGVQDKEKEKEKEKGDWGNWKSWVGMKSKKSTELDGHRKFKGKESAGKIRESNNV